LHPVPKPHGFPAARAALAGLAFLLVTACQGSFGSGGTAAPGGVNPPVNPQQQINPETPTPVPSPLPSVSPMAKGAQTYAFARAPKGLQCPEDQGFSCVLRFNVVGKVAASPSPSASPGKATATPSPTPSPTPTPVPSGSASPSPTPSPTPSGVQITLTSQALPKDAPKMENPDPKAVATVALMSVALHTNGDAVLQGAAIADFTLPKEQIGGRGFALQLFHQIVKKKKVSNTFVGSYNKSDIKDKTTLRFQIDMPKVEVKKDETWLLVLYGDELPSASASPKPSASASASPAASSSPSAGASPSPSGSPSAAPSSSPALNE
jgi:hypothetical protein